MDFELLWIKLQLRFSLNYLYVTMVKVCHIFCHN